MIDGIWDMDMHLTSYGVYGYGLRSMDMIYGYEIGVGIRRNLGIVG